MRSEIIATVARLDKSFLRVVHSMLVTYNEEQELNEDELVGYEIDGTPIKKEDFLEEADRIVDEMENGKETPASEVYKKIESWLKPTT